MNIIKLMLMLSIIVGIALNLFPGFAADTPTRSAEQIIRAFMDAKRINLEPDTKEYTMFMRGIIWGEYPELTGNDSKFVESQEELDNIFDYAWEYSGYKGLYGGYEDPSTEKAEPPPSDFKQQAAVLLSSSHSRSNAIAYAYEWSETGTNTHHNPAYPDFGFDDCTNFISQAMKAGGFREVGSGDGCKQEETSIEWYVKANPAPPLWCLGDFREWEWSTSWSVPAVFRDYFAYQNNFAIVLGWTTDVATARYHLSPGDVIQLQALDGQDWVTYHTMIVTMEDENELYVTYHSNALGFDEVDKPLSSIPVGVSRRYLLVKINFPYQVYLPLVIKRWPPIPDTPVLNPINNSSGSSSYTVSWQPAYLASTYTLQEATNANFTGAVTRDSGADTFRTISGQAPGTYYYRVKATNSWGDSSWSNIQQTLVWPTTTTFYSVADSTVQSGYPNANNGSSTVMLAGYYSSAQVMRGLVRFDLSAIPPGTPIGQARLWLYLSSSREPTQSTARTIATYRVASAWTESSVTWNTRPSFGSMYNWISIPHNAFGWYSVDVTSMMREWVSGQYSNYGVWLFGNESPTDQNWRGFSTREGATDRRPYLSVVYGTGTSNLQSNTETMFISPLATPETPSDASTLVPGGMIPLFSPIPTPTLP